jgi:hypothetical protein
MPNKETWQWLICEHFHNGGFLGWERFFSICVPSKQLFWAATTDLKHSKFLKDTRDTKDVFLREIKL